MLPVLERIGVSSTTLRDRVDDALGRIAQGLRRHHPAGAALARRLPRCSRPPTPSAPTLGDDYLSTEHVLLAMSEVTGGVGDLLRGLGVSHDAVLDALKEVRGQPPRHQREPRGAVPGAREVRARPHRGRPQGQARPRHRARRGDPARHPGAVAPHQEQPRAHRRARRRARPPSPRAWPAASSRATCPRACATSASSRSTSARWSPAPSTAASSRSA